MHTSCPQNKANWAEEAQLTPKRFLTLHRGLRPRRRQQPHTSHHKILKRLITRLPLLTHIIRKTRNLRRRRGSLFCEWADVRDGGLVVFARTALDGVGFGSPLLGRCGGEGWEGGG